MTLANNFRALISSTKRRVGEVDVVDDFYLVTAQTDLESVAEWQARHDIPKCKVRNYYARLAWSIRTAGL